MRKIFIISLILLCILCVLAIAYCLYTAKDTIYEKYDKTVKPQLAKLSEKPISEKTVTLYLKNGTAISGELIAKTKDRYIILWEGGEVVFYENEVERMERGIVAKKKEGLLFDEKLPEEWPYKNSIITKLTNGVVLDAKISGVNKEYVTLKYSLEGGGSVEQDIERERIECLLFKPIDSEKSRKIEKDLKELFPKMRFYKEGNFTIVTDSYITWVKKYKNAIRSTYTNIYLNYFNLFKEKTPQVQNYVVIFDTFVDYVEYAATDGLRGWIAIGYFDPDSRILYSFNSLGDETSDFIFEAIIGENSKALKKWEDATKEAAGDRYEIVIEGMADEVKDKLWRYYSIVKSRMREQTISTLRHEFTHEIFCNWGLQAIKLSKEKKNKDELMKKKKEFLETDMKDLNKKRELLIRLMGLRQDEELPQLQAANSWLAEGAATFHETDPPGEENKRWLFWFQEMQRKGGIYPIEQLSVYRMGSFPNVCHKAALYAYGQSWALTTFLMDRYRNEFMDYQRKMAEELASGNEDIEWLVEATGKDLRSLEKEFLDYMDKYEELEDPDVKDFEMLYKLFHEFD